MNGATLDTWQRIKDDATARAALVQFNASIPPGMDKGDAQFLLLAGMLEAHVESHHRSLLARASSVAQIVGAAVAGAVTVLFGKDLT